MAICIIGGREAEDALCLLRKLNAAGYAARDLSGVAPGDFLLVNVDEGGTKNLLEGAVAKIITYGFNGKSCVTASSVTQALYATIICCVQRGLPTLRGNLLEEQEFSVTVADSVLSIYSVLAAVTAALISDVGADKISGVVL
ncbi:MAG: hypothetical protein LBS62_02800 [Clostridiales bacterium]|jgi:hypothetical protein|nr:hypothetical protein [Clostridiales bacterium]